LDQGTFVELDGRMEQYPVMCTVETLVPPNEALVPNAR
jgi:hypothetical protein